MSSTPDPAGLAVSGDGRVVAGAARFGSLNTVGEAWRDGVEFAIPATSGVTYRGGLAVNSDGRVIVGTGYSSTLTESTGIVPVRWTKTNGLSILVLPVDYYSAYATTVSASGDVVAGVAFLPTNRPRAFRWSGGTATLLGNLAGETDSSADGLSSDGRIVVGYSGASAVRWIGNGAPEALTPMSTEGRAIDASKDGSVIVGYEAATLGGLRLAFRWTASTGAVSLGTLSGYPQSSVVAISDDGNEVVGNAYANGFGSNQTEPFLWTPTLGLRALRDVLAGSRYDMVRTLPDLAVRALSKDGKTVVVTSYDDPTNAYRTFSIRLHG